MSQVTGVPIDPLGPTTGGVYRDGRVEVVRAGGVPRREARAITHTRHFDLESLGGRLRLTHRLAPAHIDEDLTALLTTELFDPGWVRGSDLFERLFTGVVRTIDDDPAVAWEAFYRNTIRRFGEAGAGVPDSIHGSIEGFAPVYDHVAELTPAGSVLELGCCFGFLSLRLAVSHDVIASDVSAGTVRLVSAVAPRLGAHVRTLTADAAHVPLPDRSVDTVLAIHLLEHLDHGHGDRVVAEAVRIARRRVVVAVPYEEVADEAFGHVRTVDAADLRRWGRASGSAYDVHDLHGGWLVIDRDRSDHAELARLVDRLGPT
ncbi:mycofactocin oligosaccharide methyltransferase MftM [Luteipulveratus halotolerans]|uniref:Methyltransferase domain-containing protein n=1 Tax=Luteipulveratus halotolerans TaxID=1631356 RepID=A0A0L6CJD3_9MICO|nr:mycofactocin oligosaccharide methyltransferase MftM [Luteipulveratus halotolerans]KNX37901.1 hypothetical protein VV01_13215 [Luteipulveratus halotolerans]